MEIEVSDTIHIVDASIILGMVKSLSLKFDTYTSPRLTEIQSTTTVENWFWVDTALNPSDLGTRDKVNITDLNEHSMWQNGPDFLRLPREKWPLRSDFRKNEVPGLKKEFQVLQNQNVSNLTQLIDLSLCEQNSVAVDDALIDCNATCSFPVNEDVEDIANEIDFTRFSSWKKLVNVTTILVTWKNRIEPQKLTYAEAHHKAKYLWYSSMMKETRLMLVKTKLSGFIRYEENGIIYVTTRKTNENYNSDKLIVLSPKHPLTKLILRDIHEEDHRGIQHSVARSRLYYWIPQCSKLLRKIRDNCVSCRLRDSAAIRQLMAPMPSFRLKSAPVWHHSMIDLFGPIQVKDFVNQRSSRKTWAVLITCLNTRAVQAYLSQSFSTDDLLLVIMKHEARNGSASHYYADLGTQIIGVDRIITEAINAVETSKLEDFARKNNSTFHFGSPHFPEGQGAVERLVQEMKKSLKVLTNNHTLSFNEMDTALAEASYLVNCRPLLLNPSLGDDAFLCPNDIIMGRSDKQPVIDSTFDSNLTRKAAHIRRIVLEFWDRMSNSYYQSLVKYHKWRLKYRNCEPEDVVLILDKQDPKGKFKIGIIDSVKTDADEIVRKVTVKYKLSQEGTDLNLKPMHYKYAERNVRGLALLLTAEERRNVEKGETMNFDVIRSQEMSDSESNTHENDDSEEANDEPQDEKEVNNIHSDKEDKTANSIDQARQLIPTSSGRRRFKPSKLDL